MKVTTIRSLRGQASRLGAAAAMFALFSSACGDDEQGAAGSSDPGDIEQIESFLYWTPSSAILTEHQNWHTLPCGSEPGRRSCFGPGSSFLRFHRDFLRRLRNEYIAQGLTANIDAWTSLPSAMKSPANGWTTDLQTAENNIINFNNPVTGQKFNSVEDYGAYVEGFYHNYLHRIAANAYGGLGGMQSCPPSLQMSDCAVLNVPTSPQSTYFFKIHGLIDWHFERFIRGDFSYDGNADLIVTNVGTGANEFRLLNGTSTVNTVATLTVAPGGCNYYMGATGDFNGDGTNDIAWHGPACNSVVIWFMNGTGYVGATSALPAVNGDYRLVGAGDFTRDRLTDMVWRHVATGEVHVWKMNAAVYQSSLIFPLSNSLGAISLVGDFNDDGSPDFLMRTTSGSTASYKIQYMNGTSLGPLITITGMSTSIFNSPAGLGRYGGDRYSDVAMLADAPAPLPRTLNHFFQIWNGASMSIAGSQATGTNMYVRGAR